MLTNKKMVINLNLKEIYVPKTTKIRVQFLKLNLKKHRDKSTNGFKLNTSVKFKFDKKYHLFYNAEL